MSWSSEETLQEWITVYLCRNTKAVRLIPIHGYSAEKFLNAHTRFINCNGCPKLIVTEQRTNLKKTGTATGFKVESKSLDWTQVQDTHCLTEWRFIDTGFHWQNGLADDLKYDEFEVLLSQAEYSLNSQPFKIDQFASNGGDDDYTLITPNM